MNTTTASVSIDFDNSYAKLPDDFHQKLAPTPVSDPQLITVNDSLAELLGINPNALKSEEGVKILAGNAVAEGSEPLAMAYAGHQFGNWVPQLGDGRALLLGEVIAQDGNRYDIQLKGAGRTPFSRGGDGRNWVGPVLREYVVSEAMAALGVPTTRALAAVTTGDAIMRENGAMPGAILTRVARSHIRVGTFQYFAARQNNVAIEQLVQHVNARHYPENLEAENPAVALLISVIDAQAELVAHWQSIGFIHGVMNTDNSSVSGDTIDYGPCAFMDTYAADKVFSSIDRGARYAYQNQPRMAQWNLVNLAQCLLSLMHENQEEAVEIAQDTINTFDEKFIHHYLNRMRGKLGLVDEQDDDLALASSLLDTMARQELDFTLTFRQLAYRDPSDKFAPGGSLHDWQLRWASRIEASTGFVPGTDELTDNQVLMRNHNPAIIPRNHQVEAVIEAAVNGRDFKPFHKLLAAVTTPFDESHDGGPFAAPPTKDEIVTQTFCGT
ncbi:MAG: hypothetical protein ACI9XK_000525 [Granulosicoccus sp.]|jgi:uncharacterized protein YdiU (UPF0061 family)